LRIHAIWNPRAGVAARHVLDALPHERPFWKDVTVRTTTGPGDAQAFAAQAAAEGAGLVLAMGGDGTANEVARGLLGRDVTLGLVPVGSGNGLARALRLPLDPIRALLALESGVPRRMDVGFVNDKPFLNVAGVGFDALVGAAFHQAGRNGGRRGILTYVRMSVSLLASFRAVPLRLEAEAETREVRPFVLVCANGPQYGAGALVNPGARLDDGRMEVVVFEDSPLAEIVMNAPRMFLGSLPRSRRYRRVRAKRAVITAETAVEHHRDGEPEPPLRRLEISIRPRALSVLVPRATAEDPDGPFEPSG
jgi:YegS/Rv2252/BmrU family lipid kinase